MFALVALAGGLVMFLLDLVMLLQHPWLIPGTVIFGWWAVRGCRRALMRL
jgi:hypothetical protein